MTIHDCVRNEIKINKRKHWRKYITTGVLMCISFPCSLQDPYKAYIPGRISPIYYLLTGIEYDLRISSMWKFDVSDEETEVECRRKGVATPLEVSLATVVGLTEIKEAGCNSIWVTGSASFSGISSKWWLSSSDINVLVSLCIVESSVTIPCLLFPLAAAFPHPWIVSLILWGNNAGL